MIYKQDPRISSESFALDGNQVVIYTKVIGLLVCEKRINVSEISVEYEHIKRRFPILYIWPVVSGGIMVFIAGKFSSRLGLNEDLMTIQIVIVLICLWFLVQGLRQFSVVRFRDKHGQILFEVIEPRKTRVLYDNFIGELKARIRP